MKLVELAMVQIVDSVGNEKYFFTLALWSQSFGIDSLFTYHSQFTIDIIMMARQYAFYICWANFWKIDLYCCQIEWVFYEP